MQRLKAMTLMKTIDGDGDTATVTPFSGQGGVILQDVNTNLVEMTFASTPCAIISVPKISSAIEYNHANLRTYDFDILVVQKTENLQSDTDLEDLMEAISDLIENDPTLGGLAVATQEGVSSPQHWTRSDGTYVIFNVTIKAKSLITLTF